jgi:hypothetical protein
MRTFGDAMEWTRQQVVSREPKADLDQRDPDYIRDQLPMTWLLASLYFRTDVRGRRVMRGSHAGPPGADRGRESDALRVGRSW